MTEVFHGILNMPPDLWAERNGVIDELQTNARHSAYKEASEMIISLEKQLADAQAEIEEYERSFETYYKGEMRAIKMWHDAGGDENTWPDKGKLTIWLLEQLADRDKALAKANEELASVYEGRNIAQATASQLAEEIERLQDDITGFVHDNTDLLQILESLNAFVADIEKLREKYNSSMAPDYKERLISGVFHALDIARQALEDK
jgi:DNA repair exonuclease SbcCD ATPase subunit